MQCSQSSGLSTRKAVRVRRRRADDQVPRGRSLQKTSKVGSRCWRAELAELLSVYV